MFLVKKSNNSKIIIEKPLNLKHILNEIYGLGEKPQLIIQTKKTEDIKLSRFLF